MPDTATISNSKTGPDLIVSELVITDVTELLFNSVTSMVTVTGRIGNNSAQRYEFDIQEVESVEVTKSGNNWSVVIFTNL